MTTRTPTLVRVKRRITDDPSEILVLSAKRSRTSEAQDVGFNGGVRLLKLAGTVENCEEQEIASIVQKKKLPNFEELKVSNLLEYLVNTWIRLWKIISFQNYLIFDIQAFQ